VAGRRSSLGGRLDASSTKDSGGICTRHDYWGGGLDQFSRGKSSKAGEEKGGTGAHLL